MPNILLHHIYEVFSASIKEIDDIGEGKDPFSDREDAEYHGNITKIEAYCGEIVDRVRFTYEYGHEGSIHGGSGGFNYAFDLEAGEYLTKIDWDTTYHNYYGGTVLVGIRFTTNKQRVFKMEGAFMNRAIDHYSFNADDGHAIVGLKGYCWKYLNKITEIFCRETAEIYKNEQYYYNDYFSLINAGRLTKVIGYSALVIDKLQFVYDNDVALTEMHGNGKGTYFEFILDKDEYFVKIKYKIARWGNSQKDFPHVLTQIQMWTNKGREFKQGLYGMDYSDLQQHEKDVLTHRHVYNITMENNEEIFCFAGMYSKYMGRILTIYKRIRQTGRKALSAGQKNSDGKEYLFVCQKSKKDGGVVSPDEAVAGLIDMMLENCKTLDTDYLNKISFLPDLYNSTELRDSPVIISTNDLEKALLSGQYRYVSIRSHGTEAGCGNYGAGLIDVKWVSDHKSEIKKLLSNTTINFNCCECGYRNSTSQYKEGKYQGLARELVKAGVRAVFAYTIAYLSVPNPLKIKDETKKAYYKKFYNMIDNIYLKKAGNEPEDIAAAVKNGFEALLFGNNPKITGGYAGLLPDISQKNGADGVYFNDKKEIALAIGKKLRKNLKTGKEWFTEEGSAITSEGAMEVRAELKRWLQNFGKDTAAIMERAYCAYVDFYINYMHLCGPGKKGADSNLRNNNQGEFCDEFCNYNNDAGEL